MYNNVKRGMEKEQANTDALFGFNENETECKENAFLLLSKYRKALMGIATLWIFIFHAWIPLFSDDKFSYIAYAEQYIKMIGFCGVDIFLLLSGIGLTFAIKKEKLFVFYYRRIRRIILPFLLMAFVRCYIEGWTIMEFLKNISGWNFYARSIYSFIWFVPAIVTLYLFFPLYYTIFKKMNNKYMFTTGIIMLWLFVSILLRNVIREDLFGFLNRIPVFVIGVLFGWIIQNQEGIVFKTQEWVHIGISLALGFYLAFLTNFCEYELVVPVSSCGIPNCLIACSLPFCIAKCLAYLESHIKDGKIVTKILEFYGGFSLELYCISDCFLLIAINILYKLNFSKMAINTTVFCVFTMVAYLFSVIFNLFWKLIEKYVLKRFIKNSGSNMEHFCNS